MADCWSWQPEVPSRIERPVWVLRLEGADARRFLHGQSSQAIETAAPGSALATCLISPTARMRALARVLVDSSGAWLLIEAGDPQAVRTALDRVLFPADRVQLGDLQPALLQQPVGGGPSPTLVVLADRRLLLWAGDAAEAAEQAAALARRPRLDPQQQERWRLQQGRPDSPGELHDGTNPFELGLANRVSLNKGCYVGQETLAKLATYDGVKQQLRRWCWWQQGSNPAPLSDGQSLHNPSGDKVGTITSLLALPQSDGQTLWLGLALVRRSALTLEHLMAGTADDAPCLTVSTPAAFVAPPIGAGGR